MIRPVAEASQADYERLCTPALNRLFERSAWLRAEHLDDDWGAELVMRMVRWLRAVELDGCHG